MNAPADVLFRDLRGVRATLIGLGRRTHVALTRYLAEHGALVRISEQKTAAELTDELAMLAPYQVDLRLGGHRDSDVDDADVVFVTPAAPRELPVLEVARRRGIPVSNEIELFFARCAAPIIGITGSAGKTTTTTLVGKMLEGGSWPVYVGGNIGVPLIDKVDSIDPKSWVVLELSSYQLETLRQSPRIGAVLNVTPNHLDRHLSFEHYRESKFNLLRFQRPADTAVLGRDDPVASSLAARCPGSVRWFSSTQDVAIGAFRRDDALVVRDEDGEAIVGLVDRLQIPGSHNVLNVLAAAAISRAVGVAP
ncbi:MAG TPA: UDP-N-acetylmuramoyl-L-alanine--D-glutamate ligase, partial [Chloroflexota bacterium]|nr:UDP-N-acetylmuramoyl-L-alanine--D-glutamate ligase [Chloroflexota bacterium]